MKIKYLFFLALTLLFSSHISAQDPTFIQHIIDDDFTKGVDLVASDINNDGNFDIVACGRPNGVEVSWWENLGDNTFEKHILRTDFLGVRGLRAEDINNDGFNDIVAAAWETNHIIYLQNNGDETFTEFDIDNNFVGAHTVDLKDIDGDGDLDVLCSGFDFNDHEGEIAWWENDGQAPITWTKHLISYRFQQSPFIYAEDLDGDSDLDVVACGELNNEILWWENDGTGTFINEFMIDSAFPKAHTVIARDVDLDGDMDILGAACQSGKQAWYENDDNDFIKHNLPPSPGAIWLDATDIDNDGDMDLFSAGIGESNLKWWRNNGNQTFSEMDLGQDFPSAYAINKVFMDDDNDIDFIAIGYNSNKISWFENTLEGVHYKHPESCVFDVENNCWYISSTSGNLPGNIITLHEDGTRTYFQENIEDALGMCLTNGVLYVSNGQYSILGFDVESKEQVLEIAFTPEGNFDGMTTDHQGRLWVVDTGGKIYEIDTETGDYSSFITSGLTNSTQDIVYDATNNCLYAVAWSSQSPIQEINCDDGSIIEHETPFSYYDGITIDLQGNLYLSSHYAGGRILKLEPGWDDQWSIISSGHDEPAGLHYNIYENILAVPNYGSHTVDFFNLSPTGLQNHEKAAALIAFPNPVQGEFRITNDTDIQSTVNLEIKDIYGKTVMVLEEYSYGNAIQVESLDAGIYLVMPINRKSQQKPVKVLIQ